MSILPTETCTPCRRGDHPHDRYTIEGARVYADRGAVPGGDAGCASGIPPYMTPCACTVVLDPIPLRPQPWSAGAIDRVKALSVERDRLQGVIGVLLAALHVALDSDDPDAREGARYALQEVRDSDIAEQTDADRQEVREWLARGEGK